MRRTLESGTFSRLTSLRVEMPRALLGARRPTARCRGLHQSGLPPAFSAAPER